MRSWIGARSSASKEPLLRTRRRNGTHPHVPVAFPFSFLVVLTHILQAATQGGKKKPDEHDLRVPITLLLPALTAPFLSFFPLGRLT
jgi:hypothetical protein